MADTSPVTGDARIDGFLAIVGAVVPLLSAVASFVNHIVRVKTDAGKTPAPGLLALGSAVNIASINVDKGIQLAKMMAALSVPQTKTPTDDAPKQ